MNGTKLISQTQLGEALMVSLGYFRREQLDKLREYQQVNRWVIERIKGYEWALQESQWLDLVKESVTDRYWDGLRYLLQQRTVRPDDLRNWDEHISNFQGVEDCRLVIWNFSEFKHPIIEHTRDFLESNSFLDGALKHMGFKQSIRSNPMGGYENSDYLTGFEFNGKHLDRWQFFMKNELLEKLKEYFVIFGNELKAHEKENK